MRGRQLTAANAAASTCETTSVARTCHAYNPHSLWQPNGKTAGGLVAFREEHHWTGHDRTGGSKCITYVSKENNKEK